MIQRIQQLPSGQRRFVFWGIMVGGVVALVLLTVWLIFGAINSQDNRDAVSLAEGISVNIYAQLPDNDAYPAALTVGGQDGVVLTGSFKTGAIWRINSDGTVVEIPGTRDAIGAVSGLTVAADGTIYVVDQEDADPRSSGGDVKKIAPDGSISAFASINDIRGFVTPDDVAVDTFGKVYVSDRGRDEVWRFNADGSGGVAWWKSPAAEVTEYAPTGLAYDAASKSILITDSSLNNIYRVSLDGVTTETLYAHNERPDAPVFDGITVTADGTIYVAALAQDGIARLDGDSLTYIAGLFRGSSDVDYSPMANALFVTNFDSGALVVPGLSPRLPFTIDVIKLTPER